jgi:hypothetical protein
MNKLSCAIFILTGILFAGGCSDPEQRIPADMEMVRVLSERGTAPYTVAVDSLKAEAERLLDDGPWSVMQKNKVPPSGNMHDYYSLGVYWYPDPDKEDGLPYIRKDGYRNPELLDYDSPALKKTIHSVSTLAMAWFYTEEEKYAEKAVEVLQTWFLNPETKMNPHLEYGQAIPGITEGRGIGIIETEGLVKVVNGVELLKYSEALSSEQYTQLKEWFANYNDWLLTSKNGWDERMWHNNHGSAYDYQVSRYALFTGMDSVASMILDSVKVKRIARQIEADGSQPWELERTKAMGYSIKNTRLLIENAILAEKMGIDLWSYQDEEGGSILKSIEFLLPFFADNKPFPYEQIGGIEQYRSAFNEILWITKKYIPEKTFRDLVNGYKVDIPAYSQIHLIYPIFQNNN